MKKLAFNANLQEVFRADIPSAMIALKRKKELQEAIEELKAGIIPTFDGQRKCP